jgi:hypothetical protein
VRTEVQQPGDPDHEHRALARARRALRAVAGYYAGHSLGEYSALVPRGALEFEDAVRIVQARGRFMQEAVPEGRGAMAAILGLDPAAVGGGVRVRGQADRTRGRARELQRPGADGDLGRRGRGRGGRARARASRARSARCRSRFRLRSTAR